MSTNLLAIEEIRARLADRNLSAVAAATEIKPSTLYRLVNGQSDPAYSVILLLSKYLALDGRAQGPCND